MYFIWFWREKKWFGIEQLSFLVSGRGLAWKQEFLLDLAKTPPIHY